VLQIWLNDELRIDRTTCGCPRGQFRCSHLAALLLYSNKNASSTDRICQWAQKKPDSAIQTIDEMFPARKFTSLSTSLAGDFHEQLYRRLKEKNMFCPMTWLLGPEPAQPKLPVPTIEQLLLQPEIVTASSPADQLMATIRISSEMTKQIEELTRGQNENPLWNAYRKGRITASNVGGVIKCLNSGRNPSQSLLKQVLGDGCDISSLRPIQWGRNNESVACRLYEEIEAVSVHPCGIYIHESGIFGGSPDGRVSEAKIIEIKCPYAARDGSVTALMGDNFFMKQDSPGSHQLNLANPIGYNYYHQIQANMHLTEAAECDFIVWSPNELVLFTVARDDSWSAYIPQLSDFYYKHMLPKLFNES
jgi:hypothetical protein